MTIIWRRPTDKVAAMVCMVDRSEVRLTAFQGRPNDANPEHGSNFAADVVEVIWKKRK